MTFNPLRERGLESFANPQSPVEMLMAAQTQVSTQYHPLRVGGDLAALAKYLVEWDTQALAKGQPRVLDEDLLPPIPVASRSSGAGGTRGTGRTSNARAG